MIDKIEEVFEQMADAMLNEKKDIRITLKTRRQVSTDEQRDENCTKRLSFPGKNEDEAWRFCELMSNFRSFSALTSPQRS